MLSNELYLVVLPLVRTDPFWGASPAEQYLTLFPDKNFATEFFKDEVDKYIKQFDAAAKERLVGGHVAGYEYHKEDTDDGRVRVRVVQNVRE